jgi:hypothetical protein
MVEQDEFAFKKGRNCSIAMSRERAKWHEQIGL